MFVSVCVCVVCVRPFVWACMSVCFSLSLYVSQILCLNLGVFLSLSVRVFVYVCVCMYECVCVCVCMSVCAFV